MVKSFGVNPSTALPSLSFTVTVCTISVAPVRNVGCGGCWAACGPAAFSATIKDKNKMQPRKHENTKKTYWVFFVPSCLRGCIWTSLESGSQARLHSAHRVRAIRQTELLAADDRVHARVCDAV